MSSLPRHIAYALLAGVVIFLVSLVIPELVFDLPDPEREGIWITGMGWLCSPVYVFVVGIFLLCRLSLRKDPRWAWRVCLAGMTCWAAAYALVLVFHIAPGIVADRVLLAKSRQRIEAQNEADRKAAEEKPPPGTAKPEAPGQSEGR